LLPANLTRSGMVQKNLAQRNLVVLAAARLGSTRLLDNIEVGLSD
jgi:pantothenate synthetase